MIQYTREYLENSNNATSIINEVKPILEHRKSMRDRYTKKDGIPLEAYTSKVATGYIAGTEPSFTVNVETNEKKQNIIKQLFNKITGEKANPDEFKTMIDYINDYNDLGDFFLQICLDYYSTGACRWLNYENTDNEQVYARVPSWQCELIYDYSTPVQCIGAVQVYQAYDNNGNLINKAIITTEESKRYFQDGQPTKDVYVEDVEQRQDVKWYLVPFYGCESTTGALFENVIDLIEKLEQCIGNTSNIMQYNDNGCKLKITGFTPQNQMLNADGTVNQERVKEDNALLNAKVFYTPDQSGDINWITKTIDSSSVELMNKTLLEYILMLTFIPNITDESFTNADSNKALMKKFFGLQTSQQETVKSLQKELLRMWENLTDRINIKKNKKFDFRDIQITINTSIPTDDSEVAQVWMSLRGLLSDETIIAHLPFDLDVESELKKMQEQSDENMEHAINRAKEFKNDNNNEDISDSDNNNELDITNSRTDKEEEDNTN